MKGKKFLRFLSTVLTLMLLLTGAMPAAMAGSQVCSQVCIKEFKATPSTIASGGETILQWEVLSARRVEISGIGPVELKGSVNVAPQETKKYVLNALGFDGRMDSRVITVEVVNGAPKIHTFTAAPLKIKPGDTTVLNWKVTGAEKIIIKGIQKLPVALPLEGQKEVWPTATTEYILEAYGKNGVMVKSSVTVEVENNKPVIEFFTATPDKIELGETTTLAWKVTNAKKIEIKGIQKVPAALPLEGKKDAWPTGTTTYILTAYGENNETAEKSITVVVKKPLPVIEEFKADPAKIMLGEVSTLFWKVKNASKIEIAPVIPVSNPNNLPPEGKMEVKPSATTTYKLTAYNEDNVAVEKTVVVEVAISQPMIKYFEADMYKIKKGELVTLSWDTEKIEKCEIRTSEGFILKNRPPKGDVGVTPQKTTKYTLVAFGKDGKAIEKSLEIIVE